MIGAQLMVHKNQPLLHQFVPSDPSEDRTIWQNDQMQATKAISQSVLPPTRNNISLYAEPKQKWQKISIKNSRASKVKVLLLLVSLWKLSKGALSFFNSLYFYSLYSCILYIYWDIFEYNIMLIFSVQHNDLINCLLAIFLWQYFN